jgi:UDP-glucose 4-epimerase
MTSEMKKQIFLITGSNGFIGGALARTAVAEGYKTFGVRRDKSTHKGYRELKSDYGRSQLTSIINKVNPSVIFHAAGPSSVPYSINHPRDDYKWSVILLRKLLEAVRLSKKRPLVVFLSSAAVYGEPKHLPVSEKESPSPISPYGLHKLQCEKIARTYGTKFSIPILIVRLFSTYGQRQKKLVMWEIFQQALEKSKITIQGTGKETRDYLHVDKLAQLLIEVAMVNLKDKISYEVINVASGQSFSIKNIAVLIRDKINSKIPIKYLGRTHPREPNHWQADVKLLERKIGVKIDHASFSEDVIQTIQEWQN